MSGMKVVFHVNEPERWNVALGNITNLIKAVGEDGADIAVLANGPSVTAYGDGEKSEAMKGLADKGAKFLACRNSLNKMCSEGTLCIPEASLPSFITVVPAGIVELIRLQQEGYAYVKP
ncbi:MAG: hypothetical protein HGA78_07050 [Nitrospirales bacterium]|nr:hypothetical protein [Nitrospirales bacterium]